MITLGPAAPNTRAALRLTQGENSSDLIVKRWGKAGTTLAFNLSPVVDWLAHLHFIDVFRARRAFIGIDASQTTLFTYQQLKDGDYLTADGWPKTMPPGCNRFRAIFGWANADSVTTAYRAGRYTLSWTGTATVSVLFQSNVSSGANSVSFDTDGNSNIFIDISGLAAESPITSMSMVKDTNAALHAAGEIFNPEWLEIIKDAETIRFMDWQRTNGSETTSWADHTMGAETSNPKDGVNVSVMVALANKLQADPWFCMPHLADENYITQFATYVRDNLDPRLKAYIEYSNELWNTAFPQAQWLRTRVETEWNASDPDGWFNLIQAYHAKKAVWMFDIWASVFGGTSRLRRVVSGQADNSWVLARILNAEKWLQYEPSNYIDPATKADAAAITCYIGNNMVGNSTNRAELVAAIDDPEVDTAQFVLDKMLDVNYSTSIPDNAAKWQACKDVIAGKGLPMIAYEGGQHLIHSFGVSGITPEQTTSINGFAPDFLVSEELATIYQELWDAWAAVSDGPFMQFNECSGDWGLVPVPGGTSPRVALLNSLNRTTDQWW
jgi:hypothetical protein